MMTNQKNNDPDTTGQNQIDNTIPSKLNASNKKPKKSKNDKY